MAECTFGPGFMQEKRRPAAEAAARATDSRISSKAEQDELRKAAADRKKAAAAEILSALRALGYRADEARERAGLAENVPEAPLELRVKIALSGRRACGPVTPPLGPPGSTANETRAA